MSGVTIIYDGDCPLCCSYVSRLRLQESVGSVQLIDARQQPERVAELYRLGLDLERGFVVQMNGQNYHGAGALNLLALLTSRSSLFNRLNAYLFSSQKLSVLFYPVLVAGRGLLLRLLGRRPIAAGAVDR